VQEGIRRRRSQLLDLREPARHRDGAGARFVGGRDVVRGVADQYHGGGLAVLGGCPPACHRDELRALLVRVGPVRAHLEVEPALEAEGAHLERRIGLDVAREQRLDHTLAPIERGERLAHPRIGMSLASDRLPARLERRSELLQ
jgi:hypothetical protein